MDNAKEIVSNAINIVHPIIAPSTIKNPILIRSPKMYTTFSISSENDRMVKNFITKLKIYLIFNYL